MAKTSFPIGLIGLGRLGRLLAKVLRKDLKINVFSKPKLGDFKEAVHSPILILAVPISAFREVLQEIKPHLKPDTLVVDVCSVKKYPVGLMKKILPKDVDILATHPMFGPTSFRGTLRGLKIVVWPVRVKKERYRRIKKWLARKGLKVVEITPQEHDRLAARTQALSHFIGRALEIMKIKKTKIDTLNFQRLLKLKEAVSQDSWQLSKDIHKFNPYTKKMRRNFKKALQKIEKMIEKE